MTEIAFLLYPDMTALDAVGPYEVLARLPGAEVKFVASTPGPVTTDAGTVLTADSSLDDVPSAGVSAGIDMALRLAAIEAGEDEARALQLVIEYDPDPPFDSGSLDKADDETRRRATEHMIPSNAPAEAAR